LRRDAEIFETFFIYPISAGLDRINGKRFNKSDDTYCHALGSITQQASRRGAGQFRSLTQREDGLKAGKKAHKSFIVLPKGKLECFETVSQLFIGRQRNLCVCRSRADQCYAQLISQVTEGV
jgi:hypothetical protein